MSASHISQWKRLAIALSLVLAGMALIPYIALPSESFRWQLFAGVYGEGPRLAISYDVGAPGSSFTVTGFNFPANQSITIKANGHVLGSTVSDDIGGFLIHITTDAGTDEGVYEIEAEVEAQSRNGLSAERTSANVRLVLRANAAVRTAVGSAPAFAMPDGIAVHLVFMPLVAR